jgi:hypothetical protein
VAGRPWGVRRARRGVHRCNHRRCRRRPRRAPRRPGLLDDQQAGRAAPGRPGRRPLPLPPHVSDDNPYSEAQFKTLKYCPAFPERFGSIHDARLFCAAFFDAYNHEHRHAALGLHTPASVYYGTAPQIRAHRAIVLDQAYAANPQRFARPPTPPKLPTVAWINQPTPEALIQTR